MMNDVDATDPLWHIAFYRFVALDHPQQVADALDDITERLGLLGSILVAAEGINGMLAGDQASLDAFESFVHHDLLDGAFAGTVFKRTTCSVPPFGKRIVKVKDEIVPLGVEGVDAPGRVADIWAADVAPHQWRELIRRDDVVVLDNRNSFEYGVGHFAGAVDPQVRTFRDFADYVNEHAEQWRSQGKKVAMYCTGGIRCEKSSPWMQDLGLEVYQLQGGILNYFMQMPDADRDWEGECFVFDKRVTLNTRLEETDTTRDDVAALERRDV